MVNSGALDANGGGGQARRPISEAAPRTSLRSLPATHTVTLEVDVTQQFVGAVPGGYRIDLYYSGERAAGKNPIVVPGDSQLHPPLKQYLDSASVLSGNDWVTLTAEAVFDFDSRVTIALAHPELKVSCPVACRLRGRAHLRELRNSDGIRRFGTNETAAEILAVWVTGFEEDAYLPLILSASFEMPQRGFDEEQTKVYRDSRELSTKLFLGLGSAVYRKAPHGAVKRIRLELYIVDTDAIKPVETAIESSDPENPGYEGADG
jgi:hypothetical protein